MPTRRRVPLILSVLLLLALGGAWFAFYDSQGQIERLPGLALGRSDRTPGRWREAPKRRDRSMQEQIAELEAIGYLAGYEPAWRDPIVFAYRDHTVVSMAPVPAPWSTTRTL